MPSPYSVTHSPSQDARDRDPVQKDLADLKATAQDTKLSREVRETAARALAHLEELIQRNEALAALSKDLGIDAICEKIPDCELAVLIADVLSAGDGQTTELRAAVTEQVHADLQQHAFSETEVEAFADFVCHLFSVALPQELSRRQRRSEKQDGRIVQELIVEMNQRGERLEALARRTAAGLSVPQGAEGECFSEEGREDAVSAAAEHLWEQVSPLTASRPPAADPKVLLAFMTGALNRVQGRARDRIRTWIETESRRLGVTDEGDAPRGTSEEQDARLNTSIIAQRHVADDRELLDRKVLVEQLLSAPVLEDRERRVLQSCYVEGQMQEETAKLLNISQSQVSKCLHEALEKLRDKYAR